MEVGGVSCALWSVFFKAAPSAPSGYPDGDVSSAVLFVAQAVVQPLEPMRLLMPKPIFGTEPYHSQLFKQSSSKPTNATGSEM